MGDEWPNRTIESICSRVTTGGTPSRRRADFFENGTIPWFKTGELRDRLLFDSEEHITEAALESSSAKIFPTDTVLMAMYGDGDTITNLGVLRKPAATNQACCAMIVNPVECDWRYLFYALKHTRAGLLRIVVGGAQRNLSGTIIRQHKVPLPSLPVQQAIACILGALDDKIELNRGMNRTLEGMARALFQSWFVDFAPVRAKAAARLSSPKSGQSPPGLKPDLAKLFPSSFETSELGEIPKGWRTSLLGDAVARVAMGPFGSSIKTDNFVSDGVPIVRGGNLKDGFVDRDFVYLTEEKADQLKNANAFAGDIVITHRGTLGQVGLIPWKPRYRRYVVSQSQMLIRTDGDRIPSHYLYLFLTSVAGQQALLANTSQTGVPAIAQPTASVKAIRLLWPEKHVVAAAERVFEDIFAALVLRGQASGTLSILRNTLLPKLISGELRIKDAERIVGRSV